MDIIPFSEKVKPVEQADRQSMPLPALGTVVGINTFTLVAEDVTPAAFNQPPYPAAGDTCSSVATVEAYAP